MEYVSSLTYMKRKIKFVYRLFTNTPRWVGLDLYVLIIDHSV